MQKTCSYLEAVRRNITCDIKHLDLHRHMTIAPTLQCTPAFHGLVAPSGCCSVEATMTEQSALLNYLEKPMHFYMRCGGSAVTMMRMLCYIDLCFMLGSCQQNIFGLHFN